MHCRHAESLQALLGCGLQRGGCATEVSEGVGGLRREYAQSKARHLEEVRRETREAEEQAQLLQQDLQRKVRDRSL